MEHLRQDLLYAVRRLVKAPAFTIVAVVTLALGIGADSAIFAGVALVLAAVGIFGVLSYAVSQRTREIGIRMALGAQGGSLIRLIVRQAMLLVGCGVAVGLTLGLLLSQTMSKMLFAIKPTDPATYVAVSVTLASVALFASYVPARRATRVDPVVALRSE